MTHAMTTAPRNKWLLANDTRPVCTALWCEDVAVTVLIAFFGLYDLTRGLIDYIDPTSVVGSLAGELPGSCSEPDRVLNIARLNGVGPIETGTATFIVAMYRVFRWWNGTPFNPFGITVMLTLDLVGTVLKLVVIVQGASARALTVCLVRGGLASVALVMALFTYRSWWTGDREREEANVERETLLVIK